MKAKKSSAPRIDIGIDEKDRAKIVAGLSRLLADSYTLYLMTHNFHCIINRPILPLLSDRVSELPHIDWVFMRSLKNVPFFLGNALGLRPAAYNLAGMSIS